MESFNIEVEEIEARFRKNDAFILSPETVFCRTVPSPEVTTSPPEVSADDTPQREPSAESLTTNIGSTFSALNLN